MKLKNTRGFKTVEMNTIYFLEVSKKDHTEFSIRYKEGEVEYEMANVYNDADAEYIVKSVNEYERLKEENENLKVKLDNWKYEVECNMDELKITKEENEKFANLLNRNSDNYAKLIDNYDISQQQLDKSVDVITDLIKSNEEFRRRTISFDEYLDHKKDAEQFIKHVKENK